MNLAYPSDETFGDHPRMRKLLWWALAIYVWILPVGGTMALRNLVFAILFGALSWMLWRERRRPDVPLSWQWVTYAAVALISLAFAVVPEYSLTEIKWEVVQAFLLFCALANLIRSESAFLRLLLLVACGSAFLVVFSLATTALGGTTKDGLVGSLNSGVGTYSTYLILVFPFLILLAFSPSRISDVRRKPVVLALALGVLASLFFTANRQAFVALFIELLIAAVLIGATPAGRRYWRPMLALAVGISAMFAVLYVRRDPLAAVDFGKAMSRDSRWEAWQICLEQIRNHPWTGGGFGHRSFQFLYPDFAANSPFWHAHNVLANKGVQMGLPGIITFLILYLAVPWKMYRSLRTGGFVAMAAAAGIIMTAGMLAKNMTDDFFYRETGYFFWLLSGAVIGLIRGQSGPPESIK